MTNKEFFLPDPSEGWDQQQYIEEWTRWSEELERDYLIWLREGG